MSASDMWEVRQAKEYVDKLAKKIDELQAKLDSQSGKLMSYPKVQYNLGQWHNRLLKERFDKLGYEKTKEILDTELKEDRETHAKQVEIFKHNTAVIDGIITMCTNAGLATKERYYKTSRSSSSSERPTEWYTNLLAQRGNTQGGDFERWYRDHMEKLRKFHNDKVQLEKQQEKRNELLEKAREIGFDGAEYIEDTSKLEKAIKDMEYEFKRKWLDNRLSDAPYYVLASFFGRCLRGSWANGRKSYGCSQLINLSIPDNDVENVELNDLSKKLQEIANTWSGEDGRDFRYAISTLDEHLNEKDAALLEKMSNYYSDLEYGW